MLLIDIDHLKPVNDTFGHFAGNEVLKSVDHIVRSCVRPNDFVFRVGGNEFIVLLQGIGVEVGMHIGENIRNKIGTSSFTFVGKLTVTIGAWQYQAGDGAYRFLARGEEALFLCNVHSTASSS